MKTFKVYKARLQYKDSTKFLAEIKANDVEEVKQIISKPIERGGLFLNPAYAVIMCEGEVVHNLHLPIRETI